MAQFRLHPKYPNLLELTRDLAEGVGVASDWSPEERHSALLVLLSDTPLGPHSHDSPELTQHLERVTELTLAKAQEKNLGRSTRPSEATKSPVKVELAETRQRFLARARRRVDEAREALPEEPSRSVARARAALRLLQRLATDQGPHATDRLLAAVAIAYEANGLRIEGHLDEARVRMTTARDLTRHTNRDDSELLGTLDRLEAALERDHCDLDRAILLYRRAIDHFSVASCEELVDRTGISLSAVLHTQGDYQRACAVAWSVFQNLKAPADQTLRVIAHLNLTLNAVELGERTLARQLLNEHDDLYAPFPQGSYTASRYRWLQGRIAAAFREWDAADTAYRDAFEALLSNPYEAALVSIDRAHLHRAARRDEAQTSLAAELDPVIEGIARDHAEAARAVGQYRDLLASGEFTHRVGTRLRRYLLRARNHRELVCQLV